MVPVIVPEWDPTGPGWGGSSSPSIGLQASWTEQSRCPMGSSRRVSRNSDRSQRQTEPGDSHFPSLSLKLLSKDFYWVFTYTSFFFFTSCVCVQDSATTDQRVTTLPCPAPLDLKIPRSWSQQQIHLANMGVPPAQAQL